MLNPGFSSPMTRGASRVPCGFQPCLVLPSDAFFSDGPSSLQQHRPPKHGVVTNHWRYKNPWDFIGLLFQILGDIAIPWESTIGIGDWILSQYFLNQVYYHSVSQSRFIPILLSHIPIGLPNHDWYSIGINLGFSQATKPTIYWDYINSSFMITNQHKSGIQFTSTILVDRWLVWKTRQHDNIIQKLNDIVLLCLCMCMIGLNLGTHPNQPGSSVWARVKSLPLAIAEWWDPWSKQHPSMVLIAMRDPWSSHSGEQKYPLFHGKGSWHYHMMCQHFAVQYLVFIMHSLLNIKPHLRSLCV